MLGTLKEPGVYVAEGPLVSVGRPDLEALKKAMDSSGLLRARLCVHQSVDDRIHEMLIVLKSGGYVRPHKHKTKVESLEILEGRADTVVFDDQGEIEEVIEMGDYSSSLRFFYRMSSPRFHTLLLKSAYLVFKEVANGPFDRSDTIFPDWAPNAPDSPEGLKYLSELAARLR